MNARALTRVLLRHDWLDHEAVRLPQLAIIAIGCLFWVEARFRGEAFSADVFGHFALKFAAEFWAGVMVSASLMVWIGLHNPIRRWMVAVGAAIQTVQYLALGYSAIATGGTMVIGLHCTALFAPAFGFIAWKAVADAPDHP